MHRHKPFPTRLILLLLSAGALLRAQLPDSTASIRPIGPALQQLETYIKQGMAKTGVPGVAVAVVYRDRVVYLEGFGVRKVGESARVNSNTIFQVASLSKPIASTIMAALVGQQKISWDDQIAVLDPKFQLSDPSVTAQLTVRDLLCHRSGLPVLSGDTLEDLGFTRPEILRKIRLLPLTGEFRKSYQYSNFGFTEAGIAAAKKLGESWEDLANELLFQPLGMASTGYRNTDYENAVNKATIHVVAEGKAAARYKRYPDPEAPAGSAHASARDLAKWMRLQLANGKWNGEQIVAADALDETHSPQIPNGPNQSYGLGWNVSHDASGGLILSHSGAFFLGAATSVRLSPSDQLGIAVLTNALPTGLAESVTLALFDFYTRGKLSQDWLALSGARFREELDKGNNAVPDYSKLSPPASPVSSQPLSAYVGKYHNDYYGDIEILEQSNALWLRLPARGTLYTLSHWDGDTFTYRFEEEQSIGTRSVVFSLNGTPTVTVDNLRLEGDGVFTKCSASVQ